MALDFGQKKPLLEKGANLTLALVESVKQVLCRNNIISQIQLWWHWKLASNITIPRQTIIKSRQCYTYHHHDDKQLVIRISQLQENEDFMSKSQEQLVRARKEFSMIISRFLIFQISNLAASNKEISIPEQPRGLGTSCSSQMTMKLIWYVPVRKQLYARRSAHQRQKNWSPKSSGIMDVDFLE